MMLLLQNVYRIDSTQIYGESLLYIYKKESQYTKRIHTHARTSTTATTRTTIFMESIMNKNQFHQFLTLWHIFCCPYYYCIFCRRCWCGCLNSIEIFLCHAEFNVKKKIRNRSRKKNEFKLFQISKIVWTKPVIYETFNCNAEKQQWIERIESKRVRKIYNFRWRKK